MASLELTNFQVKIFFRFVLLSIWFFAVVFSVIKISSLVFFNYHVFTNINRHFKFFYSDKDVNKLCIFANFWKQSNHNIIHKKYRISSNKRQTSNKRRPLISDAPLCIYIKISALL